MYDRRMRNVLVAVVVSVLGFSACAHRGGHNGGNTLFNSVANGGQCDEANVCQSHVCDHNVCASSCADGSEPIATDDPQGDARNGCARGGS